MSIQLENETTIKTNHIKLFRVLFLNDDLTPMDLVVHILIDIFNLEHKKAIEVMLEVHENGVGLAGVFTFEKAELKVEQTTSIARGRGYPLSVTMEPA